MNQRSMDMTNFVNETQNTESYFKTLHKTECLV